MLLVRVVMLLAAHCGRAEKVGHAYLWRRAVAQAAAAAGQLVGQLPVGLLRLLLLAEVDLVAGRGGHDGHATGLVLAVLAAQQQCVIYAAQHLVIMIARILGPGAIQVVLLLLLLEVVLVVIVLGGAARRV